MAYTTESTVISTFKVSVVGSDTKTHSVTFPNAKTSINMSASEKMSGTAALFGNEDGASKAVHDVANRTTYQFS